MAEGQTDPLPDLNSRLWVRRVLIVGKPLVGVGPPQRAL